MTIVIARVIRVASAASVCAAVLLVGLIEPVNAAPEGQQLLRTYCSRCHHENAGQFEHISTIRQTPEGWLMSLGRMHEAHGLVLKDDVRDAIVQYLSDTQGLAPGESLAGRFALERRPNVTDLDLGANINATCGSCHSLARVSLQRRNEEEWRRLARMHVEQWGSLGHKGPAPDRAWVRIATGAVASQLTARYPFTTAAWPHWQKQPVADLGGIWTVVGHVPGGPDFHGMEKIDRDSDGAYRATYELRAIDGTPLEGQSKAIVYTGYEWRGDAKISGRALREIYTVGPTGNKIGGRWFDAAHPEDGGEWLAFRNNGKGRIIDMLPHALRTGTTTEVVIIGTDLENQQGSLSLGDGVIATNEQRDSHSIRVQVKVAEEAKPGARNVSVGSVGALGLLAIYHQIDQIEVTPKLATARLGGGKVEPVWAQFEAIGSTRLASGELLSLGAVPVEWNVVPFVTDGRDSDDYKLAGQVNPRGRYVPTNTDPKPGRKFSRADVKDVWVIAESRDDDHVEGRGYLIVTLQGGQSRMPPIL